MKWFISQSVGKNATTGIPESSPGGNRINLRRSLLLIVLFQLPFLLPAGETRVGVAEFAETAPVIDGDLNESCWEKAPECPDFRIYGQTTVPGLKTVLKILYTRDRVFIGVRCFQDDMTEVKSDFTKPDEKDQYTARYSIEFFLKPRDNTSTFYQFVANINDMRFDCRHAVNKMDIEWQSGFVAKTKLLNDSWTMEFAIPAEAMGVKEIRPGDVWGFWLCRNNQTYYAVWPGREGQGSLLDPSVQGTLLFGGINRWWEESVRKSLAEDIKTMAEDVRLTDIYSRYWRDAARAGMKRLDIAAPMNEARFLPAFEQVIDIRRSVSVLKTRLEWKQQLEKVHE